MTWGEWAHVVDLVPVFGIRNEWRGAQFVVFVEEEGVFGGGVGRWGGVGGGV